MIEDPAQLAEWSEFLVVLRDLGMVRTFLENELSLPFVDFAPGGPTVPDPRGVERPIVNDIEVSRTLGLARIRLAEPDNLVARVRSHTSVAEQGPGPKLSAALAAGAEPATVLLAFIEDRFAAKYGWTPTTGKNLTARGVHAAPYVSIGAAQRYPRPALDDNPTLEEPMSSAFDQPDWVNVGILDTALAPREQFHGRWVRNGPNPVLVTAPGEAPPHVSGHATFIAGLVLGVAPNALLHVAQVLDPETGSAGVWDVAKAMMRLDKSVQVLNLSFCCFTDDGQPPLALRHAVERLSPTTVVLAAAGNHGDPTMPRQPGDPSPTEVMWPAAMDRVIAVGSHNFDGNRSPFSPNVPWVRLTALGEDLDSSYLPGRVRMVYRPEDAEGKPAEEDFGPNGMANWSGTSFASAVVAGYLARFTEGGDWGAHEALQRLLDLAANNPSELEILFDIPLIKQAVLDDR